MAEKIAEGFSQAEIARELGVTRQAIQKMLAG
jgi:transcriptional regulator with XRE-family HTH domain